MTMYTEEFGPNVLDILCRGSRVIHSKIPAQVRKQLMAAVKAGALGHVKKNGLLPEIFFNPNNKLSAMDRRQREADYSISCISKVMASTDDYAADRKTIEAKIFGVDQ